MPDGSRSEIIVRSAAQPMTRQGSKWQHADASVIVEVLDGPTPRTIWARPAWSLAGIPGHVQYVTVLAKYRATGDPEDGNSSTLPGIRVQPISKGDVRHVKGYLSVGSGVDSHTTLVLDITVRSDGWASVALADPRNPFRQQ
jgi:hypothetical protein